MATDGKTLPTDENTAPADQAPAAAVDETPISPSRPDARRKNSLEQHLKSRPRVPTLSSVSNQPVGSHYVKMVFANGRAAPPGNILSSSTAAPSLQEKQKELEKHMRADSLNEKISHRPSPDELIKDGVLKEDPRSAEEKYDEAIEDEYAKREGGA